MNEGKYIYGVIAANEPEDFEVSGIGGRGDKLYTICFNGTAAVISNSPIVKYSVSRENVIAHEKAVEEVMKGHTILPVRFGTIAEDEEKVKRILEKEHDRFVTLLQNIEGKRELGLKAIFNENVYQDILEKYEDIRLLKKKIADLPPEKTHYQRMEIGKKVEDALEEEKKICKESILNTLSPLAEKMKTNYTYGERMILNAAFLVDKEKEAEFDRLVSEFDAKYADKIKFKYVGTLPPFNFVNLIIRLEEY
ncbi:MAG: GvpL/GvpF family gas vesicle protein [Candidatus Desantisbacteria bacterium]|mgnify:FL=1